MKIQFFIVLFLAFSIGAKGQDFILSADTTKTPEVTLGEVQIKASRVNLSLKKMPISVSLISAFDLESNEVSNLTELSAAVPNFFMPDYGSKLTSPVYIRGVGSRTGSPSVGLYVDNVPFFEKASFEFDFFDIKAIEVLRGPQGTLYGRNTMGGIINVITPSPMDKQGGNIRLTSGNYGYYNASGGYYGRIGSRFGYSLSLNYLHKDGFFTNLYTGEAIDRSDSYGIRNRLIWKISDGLTVENFINTENSRQGGYPYAILNLSTGEKQDFNYNQYSSYNRKIFSDALKVSYSSNVFEVTSTTSFQYLDDLQSIDQDFTPDSLYFVRQDQIQNMISQELIIRSNNESGYSWLFGGYGFAQFFDRGVDVDVYSNNMTLFKDYDHVISGYAFFHQSTISDFLIPGLAVTAGIRIDAEKDELSYLYNRRAGANTSAIADTVYPALNSFRVLPRLAADYTIGKTNIYAVFSTGYKTGGFNSTFYEPGDLTFNPEDSRNYEVGIKTSLFGRRLYTDLSLFHIDIFNQQITQTYPANPGQRITNAGRSASRGLELTVKAIPLFGFENSLSYGFTHAKFRHYVLDDVTDYSGNFVPYVPRNTFTFQTNKLHELREGFPIESVRFNILFRAIGKTYWKDDNAHAQNAYGLADFKVTFSRGIFSLDFFVKNIFNTQYEAYYFTAFGNSYYQPGKPRQLGLRLAANL